MAQKVDGWQIFLQSFFVVLGVVLALLANEWVEARERAKQVATARNSILTEIEDTAAATFDSYEYHAQVIEALAALARDSPEAVPAPTLFPRGYVGSADLVQTAWDAANATDVVHELPFHEVLLLSRLYDHQQDYNFQGREAGALIYAKLFDQGHAGVLANYKNLLTVLRAFLYSECRLLGSYHQAYRDLDATSTDSLPELPEPCSRMPG